MASSPKGPTPAGQIAVVIALVLFVVIGVVNIKKEAGFSRK